MIFRELLKIKIIMPKVLIQENCWVIIKKRYLKNHSDYWKGERIWEKWKER